MSSKFLVVITMVLLCFSCSKNNSKIIYIADSLIDCVGIAPQKCLQIKEEHKTDWSSFYDQIEGFDYKEGFFYKIKVAVILADNPPADGSSLKYKLLEILDKSKTPLNLDQGSWLVTRLKDMDSFGRNPFIKIDLAQNEINGNTSCNRFSAKIAVVNSKVEISEVSSTKMTCRDAKVESLFLDALKKVSAYTLHDDKLQLLDENEHLLIECDYLKHE